MSERLQYVVHEGDGPPLLMLHGVLSSNAQWLPNVEALRRVATPVTVEMWGHGSSPSPLDVERYRPQSYVDEFETIRGELGIERWYLCGYSLGAGITIRYAFTHPERVIAHVFTNSASAFADRETRERFSADPGQVIARFEAGGLAAIEAIPVHPKHARRLPENVYRALCRDAERLDPGGVARTLAYTNAHASVREELHRNTRPALLAFGRLEKRFRANCEFAKANMPHLTVAELEAGHAVNAQDAEGFNAAVAGFLTKWARGNRPGG
ncbi:MAG: alpha/beta fold hydrolase [Gammaproteobacteria bacterium]